MRSQGEREALLERQHDLEEDLNRLLERRHQDQSELETSREEVRRLLDDLHQAEEELEHHFRDSQHGRRLVEAQQVQLQRAAGLLQRMAVLKGMSGGALPPPPIQVMALLEGYRHSLKRAERLLRGGGGDGDDGGREAL